GIAVQGTEIYVANFDTVLQKGLRALSPDEVEVAAESLHALILDTRNNDNFSKAFIPQSINIGLKGDFAPWVGAMVVDTQQPLILVTDEGQEAETITRLARVGFDNTIGYLKGGMAAWIAAGKATDSVNRISADTFAQQFNAEKDVVIDVRKESEYSAQHVPDAYSKPLAAINEWIKDITPSQHFYLHCAGGYRSMIAASILQARGYRNFTEIGGGFAAIEKTNVPTTDFVCQSKLTH
ncbi:MAG TPA: rhodanese-like domain-containing protein, partial [Chitinophagales bacterium]|nr:rhodanese-like domain-containing protein [Chitinophagales bacterium]